MHDPGAAWQSGVSGAGQMALGRPGIKFCVNLLSPLVTRATRAT